MLSLLFCSDFEGLKARGMTGILECFFYIPRFTLIVVIPSKFKDMPKNDGPGCRISLVSNVSVLFGVSMNFKFHRVYEQKK